jgi:hypothetical protein
VAASLRGRSDPACGAGLRPAVAAAKPVAHPRRREGYIPRMQIEPHLSSGAGPARARRGALAVLALACMALAIGACGSSSTSTSSTGANGTVNTARVAASIEQSILKQRKLASKVTCPASMPAEKGKTFECVAITHSLKPPHTEIKTPFLVTIQSNRGYVTYEGK